MTITVRIGALLLGCVLASQGWADTAKAGAGAEPVVNLVYSEKGLAGKQVFTQVDRHQYKGSLELAWNNRRLKIDESLQVDDKNFPVAFSANGTSAFGSAIDEQFSWQDGLARWSGNKDEGEVKSADMRFYTPADSAIAADTLMVRALLAAPFQQLALYPSGTASLRELKTLEIKNGKRKQTVHLYAINGLSFGPEVAWYDDQGVFFAKDFSGFMRVIRDGFSMENFEQLKTLQDQAEDDYLRELATELSHSAPRLLIRGAALVDVEQGKLLKVQDLLVEQGVITRMGRKLKVEGQVAEVDGRGRTLVPGLWDMHGHLSKDDGLLNIASGVTSVRDIGNNHDNILELERLFNSHRLIGPTVYRAGFMDQESEYSAGLSVQSLEEALAKVDWFADNGYLQVKLYSSIDPAWVKPIAERAHNRGLRVSGHIPAFMTAAQAVDSGYDEIQHINMVFLNFLAGTEVDTRKQLRFSLVGEKAGQLDLNSQPVRDFIKTLAERRIVLDPTVSTFRSLLLREDKLTDPEFADVADHLPPSVVRSMKGAEMAVPVDQKADYQASAQAMLDMIKLLHDQGVPLVPGTDNLAGFTLQRELVLYAQAGIPVMDVLRMASLDCAKLMGVAHQTGSIAVGKRADLLLVEGDPTQDLSRLRNLALVVKGDRYYNNEELHKALGVRPFVAGARVTLH